MDLKFQLNVNQKVIEMIKTQAESSITIRQHKTPCTDCPWRRNAVKGWLGALTPSEWIEKAQSEQIIKCHTRKDKYNDQWQCAGSSIFRANICKSVKNPLCIHLEQDTIKVFSWWNEFIKYHTIKNN